MLTKIMPEKRMNRYNECKEKNNSIGKCVALDGNALLLTETFCLKCQYTLKQIQPKEPILLPRI